MSSYNPLANPLLPCAQAGKPLFLPSAVSRVNPREIKIASDEADDRKRGQKFDAALRTDSQPRLLRLSRAGIPRDFSPHHPGNFPSKQEEINGSRFLMGGWSKL